MSDLKARHILNEIIGDIDIPEASYEIAERRYKDLGSWFERQDSKSGCFKPHIFPQGSFRLGTVIKPVDDDGEYDLDLSCSLEFGITKTTHTQKQLKHLVGYDLEAYRIARGIKEAREEKHRCWRLKYADTMSFHMDAVPAIPEESNQIQILLEGMVKIGSDRNLAQDLSALAVAITDNRNSNFSSYTPDWLVSNPEGYARWFETRMELAQVLLEGWKHMAKMAKVDKIPAFRRKSPLQRCVQILKRHRDVMFKENDDAKPISIIITTLAARAYNGEAEIEDALGAILNGMGAQINPAKPKIPNPVNPVEDFADKWYDEKYKHLNLEGNFHDWLSQAQADFRAIVSARDSKSLVEQAMDRFAVRLNEEDISRKLGLSASTVAVPPKHTVITDEPARPWGVV